MRPDIDPEHLTPAERFSEVAAILATGLRRLRDRAALAVGEPAIPTPQLSDEAAFNLLDRPADTSVTVSAVNDFRDPESVEGSER